MTVKTLVAKTLAVVFLAAATPAFAADLRGQVLGAGKPIVGSTVTLWAATAGAPKQVRAPQIGPARGY